MNLLVSSDLPPRSLEEVHGTVPVPPASRWRRFLAFSGPAFMVSVGYMDPGNWGTDIKAGSTFGYQLLWVLLLSNIMAVLLQTLATRLGVVTGQDLAQACRSTYPRGAVIGLWVLTEIAIAATDLAEVIGTIIALKMLFGIPYLWGLVFAAGDTFLLLLLQRRGMRPLEALTLLLVAVIAGSFVFEIVLARPDWAAALRGLLPGLPTDDAKMLRESLYVSIGMLGATVMPHNLYLHSALVQTRAYAPTTEGKQQALHYNFIDSLLALNGAFFVNAAILVLAVAMFHANGVVVEKLQDAHRLLGKPWGVTLASILFAVALLASGQSSTLTGTLAGQVVMEGFVRLRLRPWVRRLITRGAALIPAVLLVALTGQGGDEAADAAVDERLYELLVLSQVILSFQLPFAIIPLVQFTGDRRRMGPFASGLVLKVLAWACAVIVVSLNAVLLWLQTEEWAGKLREAGWSPGWAYGPMALLGTGLGGFVAWVVAYPWRTRQDESQQPVTAAPQLQGVRYHRIGVAVELEGGDDAVLAQAAALARTHGAELVAIHVVEGPAAAVYGPAAADQESRRDRERITALTEHLTREGLPVRGVLGYGTPTDQLVQVVTNEGIDLLVLGSHGHRLLGDLAFGNTVAPLLHRLKIPVLVVPGRPGA